MYRYLYHVPTTVPKFHIVCVIDYHDFQSTKLELELPLLIIKLPRIISCRSNYDRKHVDNFLPVTEQITEISYCPPCHEIPVLAKGGYRYREALGRFDTLYQGKLSDKIEN